MANQPESVTTVVEVNGAANADRARRYSLARRAAAGLALAAAVTSLSACSGKDIHYGTNPGPWCSGCHTGGGGGGGGDAANAHTYKVNFAGTDACFTASESVYVPSSTWPHDSTASAKHAMQCVIDKIWGDGQWPSAEALYNQESGFQDWAINPSSGACGIGQSDPCDKFGDDHSMKAQIRWTANYVWETYGNYDAAEAHERKYNWY